MNDAPQLLVEQDGPVLTVTFNRPRQRNAMTWEMYEGLFDACERADADAEIRVMVLRSSSDKAFIAGTDISQFADFTEGEQGVAYEEKIARITNRLEDVDVPTVAAIQGFCVGGGLGLASVCDLRIATPSARFGLPIARTLGNCLSMNNYSILIQQVGPSVALDLLLRARLLTGEEAHASGFVAELCGEDELSSATDGVVQTLLGHAPISMWAAKEAVRRFRRMTIPEGDDIVARAFASEDFHRAVAAFAAKEQVEWQGR
ncbi:enoyl-CoA hydratase [Nocardioides sp. zg-1228]|uniref:enoyl-CoA hydratase n=1 Tax=Nocardioides sp. zg-1228 TaxID=2763008 RepID=UPI0016428FD8|nr:enoyl-CoA hydratase [Nocardioides sp. zg-1228]MBC2935150.1 enoyl-CoA hydratase/isomerase family protein [Nocardioides sp. zg-1228]QSF56979.1 enoyl-CoA hydratase/isomerase family protein [Nocardioides sp. zg-1228]